jgi:hypothetical protein
MRNKVVKVVLAVLRHKSGIVAIDVRFLFEMYSISFAINAGDFNASM